jgi:hypothetical protein
MQNPWSNPCSSFFPFPFPFPICFPCPDHKPCPPSTECNPPATGSLSTGPFFVRTNSQAVNVKVQNPGPAPITLTVLLISLDCPVNNPVDTETITIPAGCCAEDAVFVADTGNYEVVICAPTPQTPLRAFLSVHSGASTNANIEYVIPAADFLAPACDFCQ